ncbi:peptidylprolyl isomerase [Blastomonas fulva]|jgi:peptidyl-prolyl cis-trans isomerase A (cyclophilin A)|uniref:peptidylprolyl isomerase n=1 Tax=Blastomonas fulva TaxID=1550728 RepID=UPI003D2A4434
MSLPRAAIRCSVGVIVIELETVRAPLSSASFLAHVDAGLYRGTSFYRASRPDNEIWPDHPASLVQAGIGFNGGSPLPAVAHEPPSLTGLDPLHGTVGLARDAPGTACSEFFINLADNPAMREGGQRGDGLGVAIFGRVIEGIELAGHIQHMPCGRRDAAIPELAWPQMLLEPVTIEEIVRL